jgi:DUF1680 family protein
VWLRLAKAPYNIMTEETCTQYNVLKVARALFRWTGNASLADFYERALLNGILGTQRKPGKHRHRCVRCCPSDRWATMD